MDSTFESFNVAVRTIGEIASIYDGVNSAMLRLAQEGQKKSLLTPEYCEALLDVSGKLVSRKATLQDMVQGLKGSKEKALKEDHVDIRECYTRIVADMQQQRSTNGAKDDDTTSRLKNILQATEREEREEAVDENLSLVLDEANSQTAQKCPITQMPIVHAYRNEHCGHVFEKDAVLNHIRKVRRHGGVPKCPYLGCANKKQFGEHDFAVDHTFARATQEF